MITGNEPVNAFFKENESGIGEAMALTSADGNKQYLHYAPGITLRQHFAGLALQGLMTTLTPTEDNQLCPNHENVKYMAMLAVTAADEIIKALNKTEQA